MNYTTFINALRREFVRLIESGPAEQDETAVLQKFDQATTKVISAEIDKLTKISTPKIKQKKKEN